MYVPSSYPTTHPLPRSVSAEKLDRLHILSQVLHIPVAQPRMPVQVQRAERHPCLPPLLNHLTEDILHARDTSGVQRRKAWQPDVTSSS